MRVEVPIATVALLNLDPSLCRHHGAHERSRRCAEMHQQCWEAWETPGPHQTLLQGHCALPVRHDEARYVDLLSGNAEYESIGHRFWPGVFPQTTIDKTLSVSLVGWILLGFTRFSTVPLSRLHWRVWDHRRPQSRENCRQSQWQAEQGEMHRIKTKAQCVSYPCNCRVLHILLLL